MPKPPWPTRRQPSASSRPKQRRGSGARLTPISTTSSPQGGHRGAPAPLVPVIRALSSRCGEHGASVDWAATTQDNRARVAGAGRIWRGSRTRSKRPGPSVWLSRTSTRTLRWRRAPMVSTRSRGRSGSLAIGQRSRSAAIPGRGDAPPSTSGGRLLRPNDERDSREVNGNRVLREELGERPGGKARRPDGVRISRCAEGEGDGELVGADRARAVPVIPAAEVAVQPVVDHRAKPLQRVKHLPGRVTTLAAQRDPCAVPRP